MLKNLRESLRKKANKQKAQILQRFFKTGPGEYGEGDMFLGIIVPETRRVAQKYASSISFNEIQKLLQSKIHEERLCALLILVDKFQKADDKKQKQIFNFYIKNLDHANNWDLIDLSADKIIGDYLLKNPKERRILYELAKSKNIWRRRSSIIGTYRLIKNNNFADAIKISKVLLNDKHDLIQKAVGWMLREIGKRSFKTEETFLKKHSKIMPRTMLRYAIEKFSKKKRRFYLALFK